MNQRYMSVSQFKSAFIDLPFMPACEARALAEINGEYVRDKSVSLLVGSYIDAHFNGTLDLFKSQNPSIFTQKGELRAEYKQAEVTIARIERDALMMKYLTGDKQRIMTGTISGIEWKIMIDVYHQGKCIVDLKSAKDMDDVWIKGLKLNWIEAWGYHYQAAVYQAVENNNLPFIISVGTKEKVPEIDLISIPQYKLDTCMNKILELAPRLQAIKQRKETPIRCGKCDYCKETKILKGVSTYE